MDLRTELSYPGATAADVVGLAHDPEFRAAVCRATKSVDFEVDVQVDDDGYTEVVVSRTLPAHVPDMVKRLVGDTVEIIQSESWAPDDDSGLYTAELTVQVVGQPAVLRGSLIVDADDEGAVQIVQGEIRVSMPFIGRRFENELAKGIVAAARREQEIGRGWLSR
jgi:uncharacterized protein DUF2505